MRVKALAALAAAATLAVVALPSQAGNFNWPSNIIPKWELGEHFKDAWEDGYKYSFKQGKFVKNTENSTGYTIQYRSPNNPMEDNPCWTEQKLAFHQYVAGTCVYDPDMYKSLIIETQPSTDCTTDTIDFVKKNHWLYKKETSSSTSSGSCPTYGGHHGGHGSHGSD